MTHFKTIFCQTNFLLQSIIKKIMCAQIRVERTVPILSIHYAIITTVASAIVVIKVLTTRTNFIAPLPSTIPFDTIFLNI